MNKGDSARWAERGIAAPSPLKPSSMAIGRQFWCWAAIAVGTVGLTLLAWPSAEGPVSDSKAQIQVMTLLPLLAPSAFPTGPQEPIAPLHLSPFGALGVNTTHTAVLATTSEPPVIPPLASAGESGNGVLVSDGLARGAAVSNAISGGPSPRSDMRYQAAATWRRAMPR